MTTDIVLAPPKPAIIPGAKPEDIKLSRALLSAVFKEPELYAMLSEAILPNSFYLASHEVIWQAFGKVTADNETISLITVQLAIEDAPSPILKGEPLTKMLSEIYSEPVNTANAFFLADKVRGWGVYRAMGNAARNIMEAVLTNGRTVEDMVDLCWQQMTTASRIPGAHKSFMDAVSGYQDLVEKRVEGKTTPRVLTGFKEWDEKTGGLYAGDVLVEAGYGGWGKTTLLLAIIRNLMTAEKPSPGVLFSLEMRQDNEITPVFVSQQTGIHKMALRNGHLTREQLTSFIGATGAISQWPLIVEDKYTSLNTLQLRRSLRPLLRDIEWVAIDGLWLMSHHQKSQDRRMEVTQIMRDLSDIARGDLGKELPIIITHQLTREGQLRLLNGEAPTLDMLAESSGVERNAQRVVIMNRLPKTTATELHMVKDRNGGASGSVGYFDYIPERTLYVERNAHLETF